MTQSSQQNQAPELPINTIIVELVGGEARRGVGPAERVSVGTATTNDLILKDPKVSRFHVEIAPHPRGVRLTDLGSKNGTFVDVVRVQSAIVPTNSFVRIGDSTLRVSQGVPTVVALSTNAKIREFLGWSPAARRLIAGAERVATSDASVLLLGESGTGKELLARAIHDQSARAAQRFEVVDCAALVPTLVASELFGHEQGAFTGANRRHVGAFERAHGGTLFLDEIGDLAAEVQPLLLGALERRRFRRVGGTSEIPVNVRIIGATHRDLRDDVNAGRFRLDLYYRLAVVTLPIPPLRDRPEDIPPLVRHFAEELGNDPTAFERVAGAASLKALETHRWPGNVRELRNVVESTLVMGAVPAVGPQATSSPRIETANVEPELLFEMPWKEARAQSIAQFEARYLAALVDRAEGNVARAARVAEMDRSYLIDLLKKYKLR